MKDMDIKISNIFKERKKDNNRINCKENTKDIFFDENKNKNLISLLNKKRKKSNSKDKNLNSNNIKKINNNKVNPKKNKILENIINIKEDEKLSNNKNNVFELSERTKSILEKINSQKREKEMNKEKNKISNLYNIDYNLNSKLSKQNLPNKNPSPPKLSLKTMEIIKQLHEKRKNRFDRQNNTEKIYNSRSSFSTLHLKYDELISEKRELRLPVKYKELINAFNSLEHIINLNKIKNTFQLNTLENIKIGIESMTHHTFNMKILKQILYIVPHFYIIKYIRKSENKTFKLNDDEISKEYDLVIEIPFDYQKRMEKNYEKDFNFLSINYYKEDDKNFISYKCPLSNAILEKRKEIFKNILDLMVNNYHTKFLQKSKIKVKFNPLEQKTWYHKFDPDTECEDIPLFSIPEPSTQSPVFENTILKNDLKKEIMNSDIAMLVDDKKEENKKNETNKIGNKYVSQSFLNKIKAKERANSVINEIHNYNLYNNSLKDMNNIYKEVIYQTKTVLMTNKNIHQLKDVAEQVLNSSQVIKDNFNDVKKMMDIIKKLCNKNKEIINVINHSYLGPVVVLVNKDAKIPEKIEI